MNEAVREAVEGRLGLRLAGEASADAVVRGRVLRYESGIVAAMRPGDTVEVSLREIQLTVDVEITDQREGKTLWSRRGLTVLGQYRPGQEIEGRRTALQKLTSDIVDGAQSQW